MDSIESLIVVNQQNDSHHQERNPGASIMVNRKREINQLMKTDPAHLRQLPIRMSHPSHNTQIASSFTEVWLDDRYQADMLYCAACKTFISRQRTNNHNLIRHLNSVKHKKNLSSSIHEQTLSNTDSSVCDGNTDKVPESPPTPVPEALPEADERDLDTELPSAPQHRTENFGRPSSPMIMNEDKIESNAVSLSEGLISPHRTPPTAEPAASTGVSNSSFAPAPQLSLEEVLAVLDELESTTARPPSSSPLSAQAVVEEAMEIDNGGVGASAASASVGETELETVSTSNTGSISSILCRS